MPVAMPSSTGDGRSDRGVCALQRGDTGFVALLAAYRPTGGLVRGDDMSDLLMQRDAGSCASLARLVVEREILSFEWGGAFWLPAFQMDWETLTVRDEVLAVLRELGALLDDWAMAGWFVEPNLWLGGQAPIALLCAHPGDVLGAARADRFYIKG